MIGNSTYEYVFIRVCIFFLHWIATISLLSCPATFVIESLKSSIPFALKVWISLEAAFFLLVYLPRSYYLQRAATHPEPFSFEDRRLLFERCNSHIYDPEYYLTKWFKDAPTSEVKRENFKNFLRWAYLNTDETKAEDEKELEEYTDAMEKLLGRKLQPGVGKARCLKLTLDKVDMLHRSLLWYCCVFLVDTLTSGYMYYNGFDYYRTSPRRFFSVFSFRPHNLYARQKSSSRTLTYWHQPHTSKTRLPVLFIHGIGIGLYPYIEFLAEVNKAARVDREDDGQVGIIAVEIMPISLRITGQALPTDEMCMEINTILETHGWSKFVLVSHSYGSILCTHLLRNPHITSKIGPILLIDPVSFLLHLPDVAYNFTYRNPIDANEHLLHYFASRDMGVAHTLSRRFFWGENILWKEDIRDRPVTAVLSGRDLIVDTETVGAYLADAETATLNEGGWKKREWKGKGLEVLWFGELDHGQVFNREQHRKTLVAILRMYCAKNMLNET